MADLLHPDAVQQMEIVLMGSPMAQVVDLLSEGITQAQASTSTPAIQPCPRLFTATPPAPSPSSVPLAGISSSSQEPSITSTSEMVAECDKSSLPETQVAKTSTDSPPQHIIMTLVKSSSLLGTTSLSASPSVSTLPVVVVPELAISVEAYPEHINRSGRGKDYLCHLCPFRHSYLDCILTHVRKYLEIIIGCPLFGKGYQNATSLCKHGRDLYKIQIAATPLSDIIPGEHSWGFRFYVAKLCQFYFMLKSGSIT